MCFDKWFQRRDLPPHWSMQILQAWNLPSVWVVRGQVEQESENAFSTHVMLDTMWKKKDLSFFTANNKSENVIFCQDKQPNTYFFLLLTTFSAFQLKVTSAHISKAIKFSFSEASVCSVTSSAWEFWFGVTWIREKLSFYDAYPLFLIQKCTLTKKWK